MKQQQKIDHMEGEVFLPYPNSPDKYLVSNMGRVYSKRFSKIITGRPDKAGYYRVGVRVKTNVVKERYVHRMVCETFLGEPKDGETDINHKDCNIKNNRVDNLEYCTRSENLQHAYDNGLKKPVRGTAHPRAKLTQVQAEQIRNKYKNKLGTLRSLGAEYGVSSSIICRIVNHKAY